MIGVGGNIGIGEVVRIGAKKDAEFPAPAGGLIGFNFRFLTSDHRMIQKMKHLVARKPPEWEMQEQQDRFQHRTITAQSAIDHIHRQSMQS